MNMSVGPNRHCMRMSVDVQIGRDYFFTGFIPGTYRPSFAFVRGLGLNCTPGG